MKLFSFFLLLIFALPAWTQDFPASWWKEIPRSEAESWEVLPQEAASGEVILSKRTELGIFSNFGATPFVLEGLAFGSVEGLWQSLKYPDPDSASDPRHLAKTWPFTRAEVSLMHGFEAKNAGTVAKKIYEEHKFKDVSWKGHLFDYKDFAEGSAYHYDLIFRAQRAKLDQNPALWDLLVSTGCLKLRPDHKVSDRDPPAYRYYDIFMKLRDEKRSTPCP